MRTPNLHEMIQHTYIVNALYVLTRHDVFDHLLREEKTAPELADACGMAPAALGALLELALSLGYLKSRGDRFSTAKAGLPLTRRAHSWQRAYLLVWGEQLNPAFQQLDQYATSHQNAFAAALGAPIWALYGKDRAQHALFVDYMAQVTDQIHIPLIVHDLRLGDARTVVDVGGGTGSLVCSLLDAHLQLRGTVYDQPRNRRDAEARIGAHGLAARCDFVGGNMFASVPPGADLYLIKHALHDWDDANAARILGAIAGAMDARATLVIVEGLMDTGKPGPQPQFLHTRNLEQRVWTEGRVRHSAEFAALCAAAGLEIAEIVDSAQFDMSYLYCRKRA